MRSSFDRRQFTRPTSGEALLASASGHACALADPSYLHVAIEDFPAFLMAVLLAAAGEGGHGLQNRSTSVP
jgi:hypothetical protein